MDTLSKMALVSIALLTLLLGLGGIYAMTEDKDFDNRKQLECNYGDKDSATCGQVFLDSIAL